MQHQVDLYRLVVLLSLLAAGMFIATRLVRAESRGSKLQSSAASAHDLRTRSRRRVALRGMTAMTLLGLGCGVAGALAEDALGEGLIVRGLHAVYRVCWAPAYWTAALQDWLATRGAGDVEAITAPLGLLLIPVTWFLVFFGVGHVLTGRQNP